MNTTSPDLLDLERALWSRGFTRVGGVDEAGRGCLAGPVVAAAVVFAPDVVVPGVDDSKRLTAARREAALETIRTHALAIGVGLCSPEEIDRLNILHAAMEAMRRATAALDVQPDYLLIDGDRVFPDPPCAHRAVVKGDRRSQAVAAASIVAKVTRDRLMEDLHDEYPAFGWGQNAGYPTKAHYAALAAHGPTPYHRRSFRLA